MENRKYTYDVRQVDAWHNEEEGWLYNTTYNLGNFETRAKDVKKAFTGYLKREYGITFYLNKTLIENYCDEIITIMDRKTKEPLFDCVIRY